MTGKLTGGFQTFQAKFKLHIPKLLRAVMRRDFLRRQELTVQARLAAIVESSNDAIIAKTLEGVITDWNKAAEHIFGYTAEEAVGRTVSSLLVPPELHVEELDILAKVGRGERVSNYSTVRRRQDGSRINVSVSVSPIRAANGRIVGASKTVRDLTQLELLVAERTAQLEQARAEAVRMGQAKSIFLANMSHEIRTPMNAIIGLAYLLENGLVQGEALDLVKKIRLAGRSLLGLINDILDFSKIEAGRLELEQVPFLLSEVLENLGAVMSAHLGDKNIEFLITPPPPGIDSLLGDPLRLEQVLINLVGNAFKFTEAGEIIVRVQCVSSTEDSALLRFSVSDTGIGISEAKLTGIFSAFSQADASISRQYGGTGLGLTISRQLVSMMGGELKVMSEPGAGSEFFFTLPFKQIVNATKIMRSVVGLRVLIADDNLIAREMLQASIQSLHWEADTVESGAAVLAKINSEQAQGRYYDLLLIDWKMPELDGLQTISAIREHYPPAAVLPVIILVTAYARDSLLRNPQAMLYDALIAKPVTASALYNAVILAQNQRTAASDQKFATPPDRPARQRIQGVRVLVVDDSEINRDVAERILRSEGAHVVTTADGRSAVDWIAQKAAEIDIILMDVQMPVMDGHAACAQIRRLPQGKVVPIIALSAGAFKEQRDAALAAGMNAYIAKPYNVDQLVTTIKDLLGLHAQPSAAAELPQIQSPRVSPGLDIARGMSLFQHKPIYCKYLRQFCETFSSGGDDIARLLAEQRRTEALSLAHKLGGVAGNIGLNDIWRIAGQIENSHDAEAELVKMAAQLQRALDLGVAAISRFCAAEIAAAEHEPVPVVLVSNPAETAALLQNLLLALDNDNPDAAEPILLALGEQLPSPSMQAIQRQLELFNFGAAKLETLNLAKQLNLPCKAAEET